MQEPDIPDDEKRLSALHRQRVLDTPAEAGFDRLARIAAHVFGAPIVLVSLIDRERQWFKSAYGIDLRETPREQAFCPHAIAARNLLLVPDTHRDQRFADNPLVIGGPQFRFYCGAPIILADGTIPGTLCVLDTRPRDDITAAQQACLCDLAAAAGSYMEHRLVLLRAAAHDDCLRQASRVLRAAYDAHILGVAMTDPAGRIIEVNRKLGELLGRSAADVAGTELAHWLMDARDPGSPLLELRAANGQRVPVRHASERLQTGDVHDYVLHSFTDARDHAGDVRQVRGRARILERITHRASARETLAEIAELAADRDAGDTGFALIRRADSDASLVVTTLVPDDPALVSGFEAIAVLVQRASHPVGLRLERADPRAADPAVGALLERLAADVIEAVPVRDDADRIIGVVGRTGRAPSSATASSEALAELAQLAAAAIAHADLLADLHQRAYHDDLTGLANRARFEARLHAALVGRRRDDRALALLLFDLDNFKPVNDRFGHEAGDDILRTIARQASHALRDDDLLARIGGDEFAVLAHVHEAVDAEHIAARLVAATTVHAGGELTVTSSVGVALHPRDGADRDSLLAAADQAMYAAKAAGRACWRSAQ